MTSFDTIELKVVKTWEKNDDDIDFKIDYKLEEQIEKKIN